MLDRTYRKLRKITLNDGLLCSRKSKICLIFIKLLGLICNFLERKEQLIRMELLCTNRRSEDSLQRNKVLNLHQMSPTLKTPSSKLKALIVSNLKVKTSPNTSSFKGRTPELTSLAAKKNTNTEKNVINSSPPLHAHKRNSSVFSSVGGTTNQSMDKFRAKIKQKAA